MREQVSQAFIMRHAAYRDYVKKVSPEIQRGKFWTERSGQFDAILTPKGYKSKGTVKKNYLPLPYNIICRLFYSTPDEVWDQFCSLRKIYDTYGQSTVLSKKKALFNKKLFSVSPKYLLKEYYFFRIMHRRVNPNISLEIGAGGGMLSGLLQHFCGSKIIIIDLPEMISVSSAFLCFMFPRSRFLFPHEIDDKGFNLTEIDVAWLTPSQTSYLNGIEIDLAINTASFMEMDMYEVKNYFSLIDKVLKVGGHFYCANRLKKVTTFKEYPWLENFEDIFFEPFLFEKTVKHPFMERLQIKTS